MDLSAATEAYQAQSELLRKAENEVEFSTDERHAQLLEDLREDVDKARTAMTIAWRRANYDKYWKEPRA